MTPATRLTVRRSSSTRPSGHRGRRPTGSPVAGRATRRRQRTCTISNVTPGRTRSTRPSSERVWGKDPNYPQDITVTNGQTTSPLDSTIARLFKVIVLVCRQSDNTLYSSGLSTVARPGSATRSKCGRHVRRPERIGAVRADGEPCTTTCLRLHRVASTRTTLASASRSQRSRRRTEGTGALKDRPSSSRLSAGGCWNGPVEELPQSGDSRSRRDLGVHLARAPRARGPEELAVVLGDQLLRVPGVREFTRGSPVRPRAARYAGSEGSCWTM